VLKRISSHDINGKRVDMDQATPCGSQKKIEEPMKIYCERNMKWIVISFGKKSIQRKSKNRS
jgi:hypothetical protein